MSVRQRPDGYWIVDFRDSNGKKRTRSFGKGKAGKRKAEDFDLEIQYKKSKGEALPHSRAEGVYIDELCQEWIDEKKAQGRKLGWLTDWAHIFNTYFLEPLSKGPAHTITQADVLAVIGAHFSTCAQSTRNRYIGYIKSTFEYGVQQGHLQNNPLARWKPGREARRKSRLTWADFLRLCCHAEEHVPHLAWALDVAWNIPARPGKKDLFSLRFDTHVKFDRGGIEVFHTKVGKWAFIQCSPAFMRAVHAKQLTHRSGHLIEYRGKPVTRMDTALSTAAEKIKLGYEVCFYDVRHLWITTMLDRGLEPSVIAYLAGTSVEMIHKNYYEPHAVERSRAVDLLPSIREPE